MLLQDTKVIYIRTYLDKYQTDNQHINSCLSCLTKNFIEVFVLIFKLNIYIAYYFNYL